MITVNGARATTARNLVSAFSVIALLLPAAVFAQSSGAQPSYPGIGPGDNKAEAEFGAVKVRLYGTVLLNIQGADAGVVGQELPLWTSGSTGTVTYPDGSVGRASDNHDLILSMRQSVFGLTLSPSNPSTGGWNPSALVEADFFGTRPVDTFEPKDRVLSQLRMRLAYFQLDHNSVHIVAGQDKIILAPIDPIALSHVAMPLGATAGDLWGWLPQVRVDYTPTMGSTTLLFQGGILRPQFGDSRLEAFPTASTSLDLGSSGLGERSTMPFYQGRFAVKPRIRGSGTTIGVSAHYGREKIGVDRDLKSWATALDFAVPVDPHVIGRGEWFTGSNLIPFQGGIAQGAAVLAAPTAGAPPLQIRGIGSTGGWAELTVLPTLAGDKATNAIYVGAGTDRPHVEDLFPGSTRVDNTFIWASYFRRLGDAVTLAFEWSNWRFQTISFVQNLPGPRGPLSKVNVFDVSLAYQF